MIRFNYQWVMDSGLMRTDETTPYRVVEMGPSAQTGTAAFNLLIDALAHLDSRTVELRIALVFTLLLGAALKANVADCEFPV